MKKLFAVTRTRGPNWKPGCPLEEQEEWASHAAFTDALQAEGFVVFGGPLEGTPDVLLIIRAEDAENPLAPCGRLVDPERAAAHYASRPMDYSHWQTQPVRVN
jgi:hypothetical protein